jgi:ferric-dicitrate binding protein FerR (iron transport regulator)
MGTDKERIYALISSHLTGNISDEESIELKKWLSEGHQNRTEFDDVVDLWHQSKNLQFPEKIDTVQALISVHGRAGIIPPNFRRLNIIRQIAAVLFISVILSGVFSYFFAGQSHGPVYYEEVSAAYGTRTNIELPDGSTVFLNSGSSVRFSNQLAKQHERRVELNGEAFFKVAKDTKRPFIVNVKKLEVKALGTSFNVNAYHPDSQVDVFLLEGKVAINTGTKAPGSQLVLEPEQLAHFDAVANRLSAKPVRETGKYIGWTEGKMVFIDDPIQEVMTRLENWYNVDIKLEDNRLAKYRFTGTFVNESLEEVLNTLSLTSPLGYQIEQPEKNNDGDYSKRKITLKSK